MLKYMPQYGSPGAYIPRSATSLNSWDNSDSFGGQEPKHNLFRISVRLYENFAHTRAYRYEQASSR